MNQAIFNPFEGMKLEKLLWYQSRYIELIEKPVCNHMTPVYKSGLEKVNHEINRRTA